MSDFSYGIQSTWKDEVLSPDVIGARFLATLEGLERVDPIFGNWGVVDYSHETYVPLDKVRDDIAAYVERNVTRDDFDDPQPKEGYGACASNEEARSAMSMKLTLMVGSAYDNRLALAAGDFMAPAAPRLLTYPIFKGALLAIIAQWPHPMTAQLFKVGYYESSLAAGMPPFPYSIFHIPWIAYLPASFTVGLVAPPDIRTERAPDGGLLLIAAEETLDPTNAEQMKRSRAIAEIMIDRVGE